MVSTTEVKVERIPWVTILVLTAVFSFFGPIWVMMLPTSGNEWYAPGLISCALFVPVLPLILIMGTSVLGRITPLRGKISSSTYTFLYAVGLSIAVFGTYDSWPVGDWYPMILADRVVNPTNGGLWPWFMAPTTEVVSQVVNGGMPVPWGAWIPTIGYWWLLMLINAFFFLSLGAIFRRQWIDVERVPFPQTMVSVEYTKKTMAGTKSLKERFGLPFLVGAILGVLVQFPLFMTVTFPWFPDIYGWRVNTCNMGAQWITPDNPLAGIVGLAQFNKNPIYAAIFYMAPLTTLFNTWFWYLVFAILMQVAFTMGYYTDILGESGCGRVWCGTTGYRVGEPFKWDVFTSAGLSTGIALFYLAVNWKYIAETFNAARGKLSKERTIELEKNEPTTYRNAYALLGITTIALLLFWLSSGMGMVPAITVFLSFFIVVFTKTRVYSLIGYEAPYGSWFYQGPIKLVMGAPPSTLTTEWAVAQGTGYVISDKSSVVCRPFLTSLSSYQMANQTKVSSKSLFKVLLVVGVVGPLFALVGVTWGIYTFGFSKLPSMAGYWSSYFDSRAAPAAIDPRPVHEPWVPNFIAGIVSAGLLTFLHARFIWFPFEPVGFLLATDGHALIEGIWTMALAAWILKTVTLRVGGSKLYEQTGVPVCTGFVAGTVIVAFLGGLILVGKFFVPF